MGKLISKIGGTVATGTEHQGLEHYSTVRGRCSHVKVLAWSAYPVEWEPTTSLWSRGKASLTWLQTISSASVPYHCVSSSRLLTGDGREESRGLVRTLDDRTGRRRHVMMSKAHDT